MEVPYEWYAAAAAVAATSTTPAYPSEEYGRTYPSPAPSLDPSPGPLPHQRLQEQFTPQDRTYNNMGPTRAIQRKEHHSRGSHDELTGRYSSGQRIDLASPYLAQSTPSTSMASPYSPYDLAQQSHLRSHFNAPDAHPFYPELIGRFPSPALSTGTGTGNISLSTDTTSHHRAESSTQGRQIQKHTKHRLRDADRKDICLYAASVKTARQEDIARRFGCERSTVSKILKNKDHWLKLKPGHESSSQFYKQRRSKFPGIEVALESRLRDWHYSGTVITDQLLRTTALELAAIADITPDRFKASSGWLENFKNRNKIRRGEWLKPKNSSPAPSSSEGPVEEQTADQSSNQQSGSDEFREEERVFPAPVELQDEPGAIPMYPLCESAQKVDVVVKSRHFLEPTPNTHIPYPILERANNSVNFLVYFFDNEGYSMLKPAERRVMEHIKNVLCNCQLGIDYER